MPSDDKEKTGGSAFPRYDNQDLHQGMTLRDYFAAKALNGFLSGDPLWHEDFHHASVSAYKMADEMLKVRQYSLSK